MTQTPTSMDLDPLPVTESPTPTLWSSREMGEARNAMDCETTISLACHLGASFRDSTGWAELVSALSQRGFDVRLESDSLLLVNRANGLPLCSCATIGHDLASLVARFGRPQIASSGLVTDPDTDR